MKTLLRRPAQLRRSSLRSAPPPPPPNLGFLFAVSAMALIVALAAGVMSTAERASAEDNGLRTSDKPEVCDPARRGQYERFNFGGKVWFGQHCGGMARLVTDQVGNPIRSDLPAPGVLFAAPGSNLAHGLYEGDTWRGALNNAPKGPLTYSGAAVRNGTVAWTSDDGNHRVVLGDDGQYYREQRVLGRWVRSLPYGSSEQALHNARRNIVSLGDARGIRPTGPPLPTKLVGNTSMAGTLDTSSLTAFDNAQAFTTGGHGAGYKLTSVKLLLARTSAPTPTIAVSIYSNNSNNRPGIKLHTLVHPGDVISGLNTFAASGEGIDLESGTTFWVVIDSVAPSSEQALDLRIKGFDGEDPERASGWSIANQGFYRQWNLHGSPWTASNNSRMLEIHGYAKP